MLVRSATGKVLADTAAVGESQYKVPGATLTHLGFGEFNLATPAGELAFVRGAPTFDGCSGRSHFVEGPEAAVALLVEALGLKEAA